MSASLAPQPRRFLGWRHVVSLLAFAAAAVSLTCGDATPPETQQSLTTDATPALSVSSALASADDSTIRVQGTIPLPINQTWAAGGPVFRIVHAGGNSANGWFSITNAANVAAAILGQSNGPGYAVRGTMTGTGKAGFFAITNPSSTNAALEATTDGTGSAISASATNTGRAATFSHINNTSTISNAVVISATTQGLAGQGPAGNALRVVSNGGPGAYIESNVFYDPGVNALEVNAPFVGAAGVFKVGGGSSNHRAAVEATSNADGPAGLFRKDFSGTGPAIEVTTATVGPAGLFIQTNPSGPLGAIDVTTNTDFGWAGIFRTTGAGGGVQISTNGGPGLQVTGGTKNAVVRTSNGARALYTEESTEVWFTDYAFGRLTSGRAHVVIDATFAETVNLTEPYHVFVQSYGDAELIVSNRTASGFDVIQREGKQRDAEFSYRLVAKRLGFETERLKRAPWADNTLERLPTRIP